MKSQALKQEKRRALRRRRYKDFDEFENTTDKFLYIAVIGALVFSLLIELYYEGVFGR
jgi:hypothetical protein